MNLKSLFDQLIAKVFKLFEEGKNGRLDKYVKISQSIELVEQAKNWRIGSNIHRLN
jgi:hypothetical protein